MWILDVKNSKLATLALPNPIHEAFPFGKLQLGVTRLRPVGFRWESPGAWWNSWTVPLPQRDAQCKSAINIQHVCLLCRNSNQAFTVISEEAKTGDGLALAKYKGLFHPRLQLWSVVPSLRRPLWSRSRTFSSLFYFLFGELRYPSSILPTKKTIPCVLSHDRAVTSFCFPSFRPVLENYAYVRLQSAALGEIDLCRFRVLSLF